MIAPAARTRIRFLLSWVAGAALVVAVLPRAVDVTWHGVLPVLGAVHWHAALALAAVWLLGLYVHSFVLTAAAPSLTHRRALTLNLTGSAISNVVPLGGAAGVELNRRMMRAWGIEGKAFTGYTFLTNLWDVASKLLLPVVATAALARGGEHLSRQVQAASVVGGVGFVVVAVGAAAVLSSTRAATLVGRVVEALVRPVLRRRGRDSDLQLTRTMLEIRSQCAELVARGWLRMSLGITGYVALQGVLLGMCLNLTGAHLTSADVLAGFAVERALTIVPLTPGAVGVADLGLVGVLIALGGDPVAVTGAAVLYRAFIFAVEIPVGSGALGVWLLAQRRSVARLVRHQPLRVPPHRVAHVTDVFLPRLGGIETHVDDLVRHQRAAGLDAEVLTPAPVRVGDPAWVRRLTARQARKVVGEYDALHVHLSMLSVYGISLTRAAVRAGVPVLVTVHSMWSGAGGVLRVAALAGLRRWPVAWSAVSQAAADAFSRSLGVDVAVLPDAVDVEAWAPRAGAHAPVSDVVTLVTVGRLMPRKRPLHLVRVLEQVRTLVAGTEVRLVIVGDGPLRRRVQRLVRRRALTEHVHVTGRVPRSEVLEHLRAASVYVVPARKESFGIAALEARCAGLPVVADRSSGVPEFVRDRVDGLLVDGDQEMTVALAELVRDAGLRARITAHNRRVRPVQDWTHAMERTRELYATACARVPIAAPEPAAGLAALEA